MRRITIITLLFLLIFGLNSLQAQQKEIFIKQIEFKLDNFSDIDYENEYFMTMKLTKGITYKFKITNHRDNYVGKAVFELLDADNLILTNVLGDKYFENFNFICNKTAFYDILIKFKDKKPGNSVVDVFMLQ
jgi:hypothetical protein